MSAAANFLGDTVTYLDGSVTNNGSKPVRRLDVELNFVDTLNQVVLRETAHPLADRATPLQPGETHAFRVTFDHMPVDWNQAPPAVKPCTWSFEQQTKSKLEIRNRPIFEFAIFKFRPFPVCYRPNSSRR